MWSGQSAKEFREPDGASIREIVESGVGWVGVLSDYFDGKPCFGCETFDCADGIGAVENIEHIFFFSAVESFENPVSKMPG